MAVPTISSGTAKTPTPTGIFNILEKKRMHHSRKYDNAPMPFMQRIDRFGVALSRRAFAGPPRARTAASVAIAICRQTFSAPPLSELRC
jgi:hypothetical protein